MLHAILALAAVFGLLWPGLASAQEGEVGVIVGKGSDDPFQVAVQTFEPDQASTGSVEDFHGQLTDAVGFNAGFVSMDPAGFLGPRDTQNFAKAQIDCANWKGIGANFLVQGALDRSGDRQRAQYRVWDIDRCTQQGEAGVVEDSVENAWLVARKVADEVVRRVTGTRGVSATQIAFISDTSGNKEVYIMESDGSRRRQITRNKQINLFPGWSADASELLYTSYRRSIPEVFVLGRGAGKGGKLVEFPAKYQKSDRLRGVFSPNRQEVVVVMTHDANTDLYLMSRDGKEMRRLTDDKAIEVSPTWSPDGKRLAFASDRSGTQQIYVMDLEGGLVRRLTYRGDYNATPAWSPTGEWIAYSARTGTNLDLYLIDPDSGYTAPLMVHPRSDESPSWSPDGRKIAFTSDRRGRREIYTIDVNGRNLRRLTQDFGNCSNAAWATWYE